jgi:hypothetical protein
VIAWHDFPKQYLTSLIIEKSNPIYFHSKDNNSPPYARNTDKGLGPCAIELHPYIRDALIHLEDKETYTVLSESEAMEETNRVRKEIKDWNMAVYSQTKKDTFNVTLITTKTLLAIFTY